MLIKWTYKVAIGSLPAISPQNMLVMPLEGTSFNMQAFVISKAKAQRPQWIK